MIYTAFVGTGEELRFEKNVFRLMEKYKLSYAYAPGTGIEVNPPGCDSPKYMMFQTDTPTLIDGAAPLFMIFKDSFEAGALPAFKDTIPCKCVIIDPQNEKSVNLMSKSDVCAVTCGMSEMDTLTYSSINSESITVSLQRTIYSMHNEAIDPQELRIDIPLQPGDEYSLLAGVALILLTAGNVINKKHNEYIEY